jgi:predicted polyphosphate/ATP-dependent NAD kinase
MGAVARAHERVVRCLSKLIPFAPAIQLYGFSGAMGEQVASVLGLNFYSVGEPQDSLSTAQDTLCAAIALVKESVDIILFVGGDGTARNIYDALQLIGATQQVVLGVPAGVKMHSGVYAITPEAAGEVLLALLKKQLIHVQMCDVRDIDESAFRENKVKTTYYGAMLVPKAEQYLQQVKNSGAAQDELVKLDIANYLIDNLDSETLYVVGPGSTTKVFLEQLGVGGTLLGVDVILNGEMLVSDTDAFTLLTAIHAHQGSVKLIVTAIGGQGHILGRGNQQISADVVRAIGLENIIIVATKEKILSLEGRSLLVDSNDPELDKSFTGYRSVLVGYDEFVLYPIGNNKQ